jgi:tetratricopeptide (TPR) repeat protein
VKARLLRPRFLVALAMALGVAAVSLLTGFPLSSNRTVSVSPAATSSARLAQPAATIPAAAQAMDPTTGEPRFLDADEAGRLAYRGGNLEKALARFKAAYEANPSDAESMSNAAQILVRLGRVEEAVPLLRHAIEINDSRWAYRFNLARALDQQGQLDQAIEQYEVAAALFPDDYATVFNLALTYHRQGNEGAAIERYRRAIALNPLEPSFHFAMALSFEKLGRTADAAASYARFLDLSPDSPDAARVRARIADLQAGEGTGAAAASTPPTPAGGTASIK